MALLAEVLIDEWLNRKGYLTMRGIKNAGVDEIDLLGVRPGTDGLEACHVEAQISFRPVGYISNLPNAYCKATGRSKTSAVRRDAELLDASVKGWVEQKFTNPKKVRARDLVWPHLTWKMIFIHAVTRDAEELGMIRQLGVEVVPFYQVLTELATKSDLTGAAGTDMTEIVHYFAKHSQEVSQ